MQRVKQDAPALPAADLLLHLLNKAAADRRSGGKSGEGGWSGKSGL